MEISIRNRWRIAKTKQIIKNFVQTLGVFIVKVLGLVLFLDGFISKNFILLFIGVVMVDLCPSYTRAVWRDINAATSNTNANSEVKLE